VSVINTRQLDWSLPLDPSVNVEENNKKTIKVSQEMVDKTSGSNLGLQNAL
jgi:hypothetical protein